MGLFDWLTGNRAPTIHVNEAIWINDSALWKGFVEEVRATVSPQMVAIVTAHFDDDLGAAVTALQQAELPFEIWRPGKSGESLRADLLRAGGQILVVDARELPAPELVRPLENEDLDVELIVCHHHPEIALDERLIGVAQAADLFCVNFLTSLDHPLLAHFVGPSIRELLKTLGMSEEECLEHPTITKQIRRAQQRLSREVPVPRPAASAAEWFEKNRAGK